MNDSIAVIGFGTIGAAVVKSLINSGYEGKVTVAELIIEKTKNLENLGVTVTRDNRQAAKDSDIIFLCVKPNVLKYVLNEISEELEGKLVISLAAAVTIDFCKQVIPNARIIRGMPNVAIAVQESFTAFCCDEDVTLEDKEKVKKLFGVMGKAMEIKEEYMDAVTAVSGSGPGYLSIILEALTYAGLKVGLPKDLAVCSAAQVVLGTAKLVLETNQTAAQIRESVMTPGGTTVEAIFEIEGSGIRQAMMRAVEAATKKSEMIRQKWE